MLNLPGMTFGASEEESSGDGSFWGAIGAAVLGGLLSQQGQKKANETNIQLGREQMAFQERMSNSAYQRATADMAKAGINPMLVTQVGGANSPSGAMPQVQNTMAPAVNSAQQAMGIMQEYQSIQQSKAASDQMKASADKMRSETLDKQLNTARQLAETERTKREAMLKSTQELREFEEAQIAEQRRIEGKTQGGFSGEAKEKAARGTLAEQDIARSKAEEQFWQSEIGKSMPWMRSLLEVMRGVSGATRR